MAMNAHELVNRLLEADQVSAGEKTGVYVFGPKMPKNGYAAHSVEDLMAKFTRYGFVDPNWPPETALNNLVKNGYTFILKKAPGDVEVIGKIPAKTTPEGQERAAQFLGLDAHERVQYRAAPTGNAQEMPVERVLQGSKALEKEQELAAKQGQAQPVQAQPEQPAEHGPAHPLGYSGGQEFTELNAPAYLGIVYDQGSNEGIVLREVIPGGPAAQAGLQAGEVIVQGKYVSRRGEEKGPYYVYNVDHLEKLLTRADPQYPIQLRVVRGHGDMDWIPVMATAKPKQPGSLHIPGEEVQAHFKPPRKSRAKPAGVQQSFARKLFRPNEPTPPRESGNQPPNVSSLT